MIAVSGTYRDGQINLDKKFVAKKPVKVIVTFLEEVEEQDQPERILTIADFSFLECQKILEHYKGSLSDALIEERRSALW